jgi:hypothetical protein
MGKRPSKGVHTQRSVDDADATLKESLESTARGVGLGDIRGGFIFLHAIRLCGSPNQLHVVAVTASRGEIGREREGEGRLSPLEVVVATSTEEEAAEWRMGREGDLRGRGV